MRVFLTYENAINFDFAISGRWRLRFVSSIIKTNPSWDIYCFYLWILTNFRQYNRSPNQSIDSSLWCLLSPFIAKTVFDNVPSSDSKVLNFIKIPHSLSLLCKIGMLARSKRKKNNSIHCRMTVCHSKFHILSRNLIISKSGNKIDFPSDNKYSIFIWFHKNGINKMKLSKNTIVTSVLWKIEKLLWHFTIVMFAYDMELLPVRMNALSKMMHNIFFVCWKCT